MILEEDKNVEHMNTAAPNRIETRYTSNDLINNRYVQAINNLI